MTAEEQRRLEKLNQWLALFANFGVLIGIGILVFEVRQNTAALQTEIHQAIFAGGQEELYTSMEYPDVFRLMAHDGLEMDFTQRLRMDLFLTAALGARQFAWRQYQAGSIDSSTWSAELEVVSILVGSKRTRDWWNEVGILQFTGEFRELVNGIVENEPLHPYWVQVATW